MQDDEVAVLIEEFNGTVRNLNKLIDEVEKKQHLLYEAEIKALHSKSIPTLFLIYWRLSWDWPVRAWTAK